MMCVNDTLPPRARARWLLITILLSMSSLTGTERTLVAVGTVRLASMFCAVRPGAPRSTVSDGSSLAADWAGFSGSFGTGRAAGGWVGLASERPPAVGDALPDGFAGAGLASVGALAAAFSGAAGLAPLRGPSMVEASVPGDLFAKKSHQTLSTLFGSRWYCSYISSTSHSLAPKSASGSSADWLPADCPADAAPFEDSATA